MATLNFLTGLIEGKLGETTGAKWKNKAVLKSRIDGRVPMAKVQIDSRLAFESLNRLSVDFSRIWWKELGLSDAKMLKHNAVAHFMKPAVDTHIFQPHRCLDNMPESTIFNNIDMTLKDDYSLIYVNIEKGIKFDDVQDIKCYIACINDIGQITGHTSFIPKDGSQIIPMDIQIGQPIVIVSFIVFKLYGKLRRERVFGGFRMGYTYSTTERLSGDTWIDGKAIYMKTIQATISVPNQETIIQHNITDFGSPIKIEGMLRRQNSDWLPICFAYNVSLDYHIGAWMDQNRVRCRVGSLIAVPSTLILTLYYTKNI